MTLTNQNIETLVELCQQGNKTAQLEIYDRYSKGMFNVAFRIVKDQFEAEDIMQEAFLTAFTKLDKLKNKNTFGAWLKRIVVNNSIYQYNKTISKNNVPIEPMLYKVEDQTNDHESNSENKEKVAKVIREMNHLKDNYRLALTLHLIEGYDYDEICDIMKISYANCRTTISRAKEQLRKKLEPIIN
ncbi:RNA polymerase sigma factor [Mangrovimonas aestuarii]|uniref:RNA polymerase sigma factor n=1 Tax=Mangrovimonas aestuarii TaxID=3018443 RepID=UPI002379FCC3|nr:RNA polymerase sigma factor [Mangrovimonas aestuarii]